MKSNSRSFFAHETTVIDSGAFIEPGVQIWHFSHIMPGSRIGKKSKLGQNVFVDRDVVIGRNVKIQNNVSVYRGVTLEDDVFIGPSVVFTNVVSPRSRYPKKPEEYSQTRIGTGATLGANATIVCGITIGEHAFVGAGSVVTRDVPSYALVYGVPATRKRWVCICGEGLPNAVSRKLLSCRKCGESYAVSKQSCKKI